MLPGGICLPAPAQGGPPARRPLHRRPRYYGGAAVLAAPRVLLTPFAAEALFQLFYKKNVNLFVLTDLPSYRIKEEDRDSSNADQGEGKGRRGAGQTLFLSRGDGGGLMPGVLLLTAMDTRGEETVFLKGLIEALGREVILLDVAMRRHGFEGADYTCAEVARAGGDDFDRISAQKGTSEIIGPMRKGAIAIARRLYRQGAISAIAGMGGTSNTLLASSVMAALPFGFPKCILCSSAAVPAYAARFFADRDIAVLHACVEINGLNPILNEVLRQFAGMVTGMAGGRAGRGESRAQDGGHLGFPVL